MESNPYYSFRTTHQIGTADQPDTLEMIYYRHPLPSSDIPAVCIGSTTVRIHAPATSDARGAILKWQAAPYGGKPPKPQQERELYPTLHLMLINGLGAWEQVRHHVTIVRSQEGVASIPSSPSPNIPPVARDSVEQRLSESTSPEETRVIQLVSEALAQVTTQVPATTN